MESMPSYHSGGHERHHKSRERGIKMTAQELLDAYAKGQRYFIGANLSGANLSGANLWGADLGDQWIIQGPTRSDGYQFILQKLTSETEPMVTAGCQYFSISDARKHWTDTRGGTPLGDETFAILDCLEALAKIRGLI